MKNDKQQIKILQKALKAARFHLEYIGYGDSYEREGAFKESLPELIDTALNYEKQQNTSNTENPKN